MQGSFIGKGNRLLQRAMLVGILLDLAFIAMSLLLYPSLLGRESVSTVIAPIVLLLLYASVGIVLTRRVSQVVTTTLRQGTAFGLMVGVLFLVDISVEDFIDLERQASALATLGFMALIFLLFGCAGFYGTQKTGKVRFGMLTSVWCAMISVVIVVIFGFAINFFFTQRLEYILASDYASSGIADPRAFTFYNTLDSASSHLLEAPILASVFGTIGGFVCKGWMWFRASR